MKSFDDIINSFVKLLMELENYSSVVSVTLGGSQVSGVVDSFSDVDLMLICFENSSKKLYDELKRSIRNESYFRFLDVKIIETSHIHQINNSISSPFFYHFMKNSIVLIGKNLKDDFKLKEIWCYHAINSYQDKLRAVEELIENYQNYSESKILLYEIAKRFIIIAELLF
ncbi:MAG: hypothetical protein HGN29_03025 [Asgard group archaeon]|nr:hypothetical protein [Asgard group archaeon]